MRLCKAIVVALFLCLFCSAQSPVQQIDSILNQLHNEEDFNGNVLISEKGKIIYEKSFGYANYENKTPLTKDSIFLIGSVSKTFTATAILKLKEQGKLNLDDNILKFLPDLPYKDITIRHLLTHMSGLPEYQSPEVIKEIEGKGVNNAELEKVFAGLNLKQEFPAGSKWEYSNTNYIFLALIVEKASSISYPQFLQKYIFEPAGMKMSFVLKGNVPAQYAKNIVDGYRQMSYVSLTGVNVNNLSGGRSFYLTVSNLYGAGGIYSTAGDLNKFHRALQSGKILKKQTLAEMYNPAKSTNGKDYETFRNSNYLSAYGLGWFVARDESTGKIVYHSGGSVGYASYFLWNTAKDQCVIILTNNELIKHYTPTALMKILNSQAYKLDSKSLAKALGREYVLRGLQGMEKLYDRLKLNPDYTFREGEMNDLGYQLMLDKNDSQAAIRILKLNAEKFPASYNVWDSLGEIYYKAGNRDDAIKNYEKSLQLNPKNEEGKQMLDKIRSEVNKP